MKAKLKLQDNQSALVWDDEGNFQLYPAGSMKDFVQDLRDAADDLEKGEYEFD
jgi:hypothetical protein